MKIDNFKVFTTDLQIGVVLSTVTLQRIQIDPFHGTGPLLNPLKTSGKLQFSDD